MHRSPTLVLVFASALIGSLVAQKEPSASPRPTPLQEAAANYNAAEWPRGERRAGLDLGAIELRGYAGAAVEHAHPGPRQRLFADQNGENRVLLEVFVDDDAAAAGERLLWWLAHVSKPGRVPTAAAGGIPVGDVGYVGWSNQAQQRIGWIAFVRGNVAVRAVCLDPSANPHPGMAAIAQAVDAVIGREPVVAAGTALPRPVIERFSAPRASCRAGDVVPLTVLVADPAGAPLQNFVIEAPGQGYVERAADGTWRLHTTAAGRTTLHLHATGVRGLVATSKLVIDVAERR